MARITLQNADALTGAFNSSDRNAAYITVDYPHRLVSAHYLNDNSVTTGTVEIKLRRRLLRESRGGSQVGKMLDNALIDAEGTVLTKREFTLHKDDTDLMVSWAQYFVNCGSSDSADRSDNPALVIEVDDNP